MITIVWEIRWNMTVPHIFLTLAFGGKRNAW
jgi:hypothetical protein